MGASFLEYAIVAFLVLILGALLAMGLLRARETARDQLCVRKLVLLSRAVNERAATEVSLPGYVNPSKDAQTHSASWVASVLPFLDERLPLVEATAEGWELKKEEGELQPKSIRPWQDWKKAKEKHISQLICPSEDSVKLTGAAALSYVANCGYPDARPPSERPDFAANGVFLDLEKLPPVTPGLIESLDGTEHTLLLGENVQAGPWDSIKEADTGFVWTERLAGLETPRRFAIPEVLAINQETDLQKGGFKTARPSSRHRGGVHAAFASTRVGKITDEIDPVVYIRLCTIDDTAVTNPWSGEAIGPPIGRTDEVADKQEDKK